MSEERRNRILDACSAMLLTYGYDKMTVSDIAEEAGVSKGAIYLHFASKEAMAEALIWREAEIARQEISALLKNDPKGGSFFTLYLHSLRVATSRPLLRSLYANRKQVWGDLLRTLAPKFANARSIDASNEFVQQYQALGLIRPDVQPRAVVFLMAIIRYGLLTIDDVIPSDERPDMEDFLMLVADVLSRGLGTEGGDIQAGREKFNDLMETALQKSKSSADLRGDDEQ